MTREDALFWEKIGMSFLNNDNVLFIPLNGEFIGKRSVWTKDKKAMWLEETTPENIKTYWCGKDADYTQTFELVKGRSVPK